MPVEVWKATGIYWRITIGSRDTTYFITEVSDWDMEIMEERDEIIASL